MSLELAKRAFLAGFDAGYSACHSEAFPEVGPGREPIDAGTAWKMYEKTYKGLDSPMGTLGALGEDYFVSVFGGIRNNDPFATHGDIVLDGKNVEVKTQNSYTERGHTYMTIRNAKIGEKHYTNLNKCMTVDRLIFVEYVADNDYNQRFNPNDLDRLRIWECTNRVRVHPYTTRDGRHMLGFPLSEMTLLHEEHNPELAAKFHKNSTAGKF